MGKLREVLQGKPKQRLEVKLGNYPQKKEEVIVRRSQKAWCVWGSRRRKELL